MPPRKPAAKRKLTRAALERSALWNLQRRALTEVELRRALDRKVRRSLPADAVDGADPAAVVAAWIDDIVARSLRSALVDDARVAGGKAASLAARGKSARAIAMKLRQAGVEGSVVAGALAEHDDDAAAREYVRRKRLKEKDPHKALQALARQGFSFAVARRALAE